MANPYSWLTWSQAVSALQGRLANVQYWTVAELQMYLAEALRLWNALTEQWQQDFTFNAPETTWVSLGTISGSPRLRTVTDAYLYTQMQYMLLEAPTGAAAWGGTTQFELGSFQSALQKRRDELIQATNCNLTTIATENSTPNTRLNYLQDTVLEPQRIRFMANGPNTTATALSGSMILTVASPVGIGVGQYVTGLGVQAGSIVTAVSGSSVSISAPVTVNLSATAVQFASATTLIREDTQAFQYFDPNYLQQNALPQSWSVASQPPLAFEVDNAPNVAGYYDLIALQSGAPFNPPNATLLSMPDDWSMVIMYGALADLLGRESEATDNSRAAYCLKRYTDGIQMMQHSNWFVQANINNFPADTPSLFEMDSYDPEWQNSLQAWPTLVNAGMDYVGITPSTGTQSVNVTLVGNQPISTSLTDYVQISRDSFDVVLSYAQRVAAFKMGGAEWAATESLEVDFYRAAASTNKRLLSYGIFTDILHSQGRRQGELVPR